MVSKNKQQRKGSSVQKTSPVSKLTNPSNRNVMGRRVSPIVRSTPNGVIIRNTEYLADIVTPASTPTLAEAALQPGYPTVFSWLSGIARNYSSYRWKHLRAVYVSSCGTATNGDISMGVFYDSRDVTAWLGAGSQAFTALMGTQGSVSGPFWSSTMKKDSKGSTSELTCELDVKRAHARTPYHLIAPNTAFTDSERNQTIAAWLCWITSPSQVTPTYAGKLYLDYEIELVHPTGYPINQ